MKKEAVILISLILVFGIFVQLSSIRADDNGNGSNAGANITAVHTEDNGSNSNETEIETEDNSSGIRFHGNAAEMERERNAFQERNRLRLNASQVPENCTVSGVAVKCGVRGNRTMVVFAGKSGNIIVQVKGVNMSTQVALFKGNGTMYGLLENNSTVILNYLPDQLREMIQERLHAQTENETINLTEDGNYSVGLQRQARFLGLFRIRERITMKINPETGDVLEQHAPWWGFLASGVQNQTVVGASCGTVTPGQNDACCQNKGYDLWNSTSAECGFNVSSSS